MKPTSIPEHLDNTPNFCIPDDNTVLKINDFGAKEDRFIDDTKLALSGKYEGLYDGHVGYSEPYEEFAHTKGLCRYIYSPNSKACLLISSEDFDSVVCESCVGGTPRSGVQAGESF
ncbi:hypothetical protein Fot_06761 [Forsythia ovata]|uniref:Uncharacterized protein n=1 Tax=Forsythia ovata TaxID=205694 RepID=A0ABD1WU81_9LAMI